MAEEKKQSVTVYSYRKVWFVEKKDICVPEYSTAVSDSTV